MRHQYTIVEVIERIRQGETPWVAIGDFLDDWYRSSTEYRLHLISEPPITKNTTELQWAAVCAACVEHLCIQDHVTVPSWVCDPKYILPQPWYIDGRAPSYRKWLEETSFPTFKSRNIMAGDRVLLRA